MLDQQDGDAPLVADAPDQVGRARRSPSWLRPPAGSSSSSSFGRAGERARKLDALLRCRTADRRRGRCATSLEIEITRSAPRRCRRSACSSRRAQGAERVAEESRCGRADGCRPRTLSSTDMVRNSARFWNVRPMPMLGDAVRRRGRGCVRPSNRMSPRGRRVEAAEAVEQRGLAGAVRADQAENLPSAMIERDAVERDDAAEIAPRLL